MTRIRITEFPDMRMTAEQACAALPALMTHVENRVLPEYVKLGRLGSIAVSAMRADLQDAREALAARNAPSLLRCYFRLKEYRT